MRMKSKKALDLCRECREMLLSEISTVERKKVLIVKLWERLWM